MKYSDIDAAKLLRTIRTVYKLSQKDFAKIIECSRSFVSDYERNKTNVLKSLKSSQVAKLCLYFGISSDFLLGV
jgi:transcriptional regulator with XRE-family HTH domain